MNSLKTSRPEAPIAILTPTSRTRSFNVASWMLTFTMPAADQRQNPGEHEDHVVDLALAPALAHPCGDVVDPEILLEPVGGLQGRRQPLGEVLHHVDVRDLEDDPVHAVVGVSLHAPRDERWRAAPRCGCARRRRCPRSSRQWKIFSFRTPTTVTGMSPTRMTCPTASPVGKKTLRPRLRARTTGVALATSSRREEPSSLDLVAVQRQVVGGDPGDLALLVGVRGAHAQARELLDADRLHRLRVDPLAVGGVVAPEAEIRVLEGRGRRAVLDGVGRLHVQLVEAARLAQASSEWRRWLSEIEKPPSTDATPSITPSAWRIERPRFSRISIHALREALAEGAGHDHALRPRAPAGPSDQAVVELDRRWASAAMCGSCVTRITVLPWRCSSWKSSSTSAPGLRIERAGRLVGEEEGRAVRERPRDRDALPLPARERAGRTLAFSGMPTRSSSSQRPPAPLLARDARVEQRQLDVARDRRLRKEVVVLEDEADLLVADSRERGPDSPSTGSPSRR